VKNQRRGGAAAIAQMASKARLRSALCMWHILIGNRGSLRTARIMQLLNLNAKLLCDKIGSIRPKEFVQELDL
jgi:hypothetical protein